MAKEKAKRIQFDFSPDALSQIEELVKNTGAASKAEVIRKALKLYEYTVEMLRNSYDLTFQREGETKTVELLIDIKKYPKINANHGSEGHNERSTLPTDNSMLAPARETA